MSVVRWAIFRCNTRGRGWINGSRTNVLESYSASQMGEYFQFNGKSSGATQCLRGPAFRYNRTELCLWRPTGATQWWWLGRLPSAVAAATSTTTTTTDAVLRTEKYRPILIIFILGVIGDGVFVVGSARLINHCGHMRAKIRGYDLCKHKWVSVQSHLFDQDVELEWIWPRRGWLLVGIFVQKNKRTSFRRHAWRLESLNLFRWFIIR